MQPLFLVRLTHYHLKYVLIAFYYFRPYKEKKKQVLKPAFLIFGIVYFDHSFFRVFMNYTVQVFPFF
jgi:hypothetical protein